MVLAISHYHLGITMLPDIRHCREALEERSHPMVESNNMASQRFCLRWNNHQSNLLSVFEQLLQEQCFVDVTLAVEGRFLRAHKMVLSACSPYFQTLFTEHPDKHPIVILKDVPYTDMRCLLDFMYRGEVSVNQDRLTAFLKVAETLRIKGLTEVNDDRNDLPGLTHSLMNSNSSHLPPPQLHRINPRPLPYQLPASAPLLGSALTAPKRKRGRPRKLSGSSELELESDGERGGDSSLNLPELLEVNMDDGRDERCSNGGTDGDRDGDMDADGDDPLNSSGQPPTSHNPFQLGELLKPKLERRSSDESFSFEFPIKREPGSSPFSSEGGSGGPVNTSGDGGGSGTITPTSSGQKPVIRRRIRRRANSSSQDPAEHLTEMSVRGNESRSQSPTKAEVKSEAVEGSQGVGENADSGSGAGFHFLTEEGQTERASQDSINEIIDNLPKARSDLLEYLTQPDGSVVCKWCGELLPSRTHWYRHKYKLHVPPSGLPAGLVKCLKCNTFFKSRKGYIGHCVTRHGSVEAAERDDEEEEEEPIIKTEVDDEDVENVAVNVEKCSSPPPVSGRGRKRHLKEEMEDYMRQREREEKLVADIIAKVKKECEAQSITMCRRGYSRRSTVMTSFREYDKRK